MRREPYPWLLFVSCFTVKDFRTVVTRSTNGHKHCDVRHMIHSSLGRSFFVLIFISASLVFLIVRADILHTRGPYRLYIYMYIYIYTPLDLFACETIPYLLFCMCRCASAGDLLSTWFIFVLFQMKQSWGLPYLQLRLRVSSLHHSSNKLWITYCILLLWFLGKYASPFTVVIYNVCQWKMHAPISCWHFPAVYPWVECHIYYVSDMPIVRIFGTPCELSFPSLVVFMILGVL